MKTKMNSVRGGGIASKKLLAAVAVLAVMFAAVAAILPAIDDADAATDITYVSGTINEDFPVEKGNVVVIDKDLNIKNGAAFIVKAGAVVTVNEGVKVTVDGAKEVVNGGTKTSVPASFIVEAGTAAQGESDGTDGARVIVNGQIIVGENGTAMIGAVKNAQNSYNSYEYSAAFDNNKKDDVYAGTFVYGTIAVQKGGVASVAAQIMNGGALSVTSTGTKVSQISGDIAMMSGSVVEVKGVINGNLNITASEIDQSKEASTKIVALDAKVSVTGTAAGENLTSAKVSDLKITADAQSATGYVNEGDSKAKNTIYAPIVAVSGTVQNGDVLAISETESVPAETYADKDGKKALDLSASVVVASGATLDVKNGGLTVGADFVVAGTVTATKLTETTSGETKTTGATITLDNGEITVSGTVEIDGSSVKNFDKAEKSVLVIDGGKVTVANYKAQNVKDFKGAYYTYDSNSVDYLVACELSEAIKAADGKTVTNVTVCGLDGSATATDGKYEGAYEVSESFALASGVTLTVHNGLIVGEEYVITVPVDGVIASEEANIVVNGKLVDNTMGLKTTSESGFITAQVVIKDEESAVQTFTSLALAIKDTASGKIVLAGDVILDKDMTITKDLTVVVGNFNFTVKQNVVLTVQGVLDDSNGKLVTECKDYKNKAGSVVVENYVIVADSAAYSDKLATEEATTGFNVPGVYVTVDIDGIEANTFVMAVPVFATYSAQADEAVFQGTVSYKGDLTLNGEDKTLSVGETGVVADVTIDGTLTLAGYTLSIDNGTFTGKIADEAGSVQLTKVKNGTTTVDGKATAVPVVIAYQKDDEGVVSLLLSGTPGSTKDGKKVSEIAIASGTLTISSDVDVKNLKSFGVAADTVLAVSAKLTASDMTVEGTLDVAKAGSVGLDNLTVLGTVKIADDSAGIEATKNVYVGADGKTFTGAAASVEGKALTADLIYVLAGSSISEDIVKGLESTTFTVQDVLKVTVYGGKDKVIVIADPEVENAKFVNWVDEKGNDVAKSDIKTGMKLTAKIDENIYSIRVIGDNGIGSVAIDGNVLQKSSNVFYVDDLKAGSHTITYDVKYGYEGTVVIKVNGTAISGTTFTLSGTSEKDTNVSIDLSGTAPVKTVVPEPAEDSDDGMGLTDYLLIVLVVLIVILAVIVAMRLMRS